MLFGWWCWRWIFLSSEIWRPENAAILKTQKRCDIVAAIFWRSCFAISAIKPSILHFAKTDDFSAFAMFWNAKFPNMLLELTAGLRFQFPGVF